MAPHWLENLDFALTLLVKLVGLLTLIAFMYALFTGYRYYYSAPGAVAVASSGGGGGFFRSLNLIRKLVFGCACDRPPASNY